MRLLGLSIAVLALSFPATGSAQNTTLIDVTPPRPRPRALQMKDLLGSWAREGEKEVRYTFHADSTANVFVQTNAGPGTAAGQWQLKGDTLSLNHLTLTAKGQKSAMKFDRRQVILKDGKLTLTRVDNGEQGPKTRVYERVDSAKAEPSKPSK